MPSPTVLLATGGASANRGVLQIIADVFQAEVARIEVKNASALGAALRAAHGVDGVELSALYERFAEVDRSASVRPDPATRGVYDALLQCFAEEVDRVLGS